MGLTPPGGTPLNDADRVRMRGIGLFAPLPPDTLAALLAGAWAIAPAPFESLFEQEQQVGALFVVMDGTIGTLAALGPQESCLVALLGPGQVVGEGGLFDTGCMPLAARAITPARLVAIPAAAVLACLDTDAPFRRRMLAFLSARLRVLVRQISQLKLMSAPQRLGLFLLGLTEPQDGPQTVQLMCDRRIIAGLLGMTPECLSRSLRSLQALGVRNQGKRGIVVEDREQLSAYCQP